MNAVKMMRYLLLIGVSYFKRVAMVLPIALLIIFIPMVQNHAGISNLPIIGFMCFVFANFVVLFPLSVLDKVPQAFAFLPQRKADVVPGIYLLLLIVLAAAFGVGLAGCFIGLQGTIRGLCFVALAGSLVMVSITQGVLIPCILRFGYTKAQPIIFLCIFGLSTLAGLVFKQNLGTQSSWKWMLDFAHPALPVLTLILLAAVILFVSYLVSRHLYQKKDI